MIGARVMVRGLYGGTGEGAATLVAMPDSSYAVVALEDGRLERAPIGNCTLVRAKEAPADHSECVDPVVAMDLQREKNALESRLRDCEEEIDALRDDNVKTHAALAVHEEREEALRKAWEIQFTDVKQGPAAEVTVPLYDFMREMARVTGTSLPVLEIVVPSRVGKLYNIEPDCKRTLARVLVSSKNIG